MPELHAAPCAVDPCMTRTGTRMRRAPACGECARTCEAAMHLPAAAPRLRGGGRRRAREGSTAVRRGERGQAARTGDSDISVRASGGSRSWGLQKLGIAADPAGDAAPQNVHEMTTKEKGVGPSGSEIERTVSVSGKPLN